MKHNTRAALHPSLIKILRAFGVIGFVVFLYIAVTAATLERRLTEGVIESWSEKSFYAATPLPSKTPGTLIRSEKLTSVPNGMIGWRVIYVSTDHTGTAIQTSGLVIAPDSATSLEKRKVVAWGHPTTGTAQRCAPSSGTDPFDTVEGIRTLVHAGYVVAAPDYSGMGMSGPPSFLIGETEGRNMLDAVRAAQHIPATNAGTTLALWGHSQGGHAALFAAEIAATYAPEFILQGVATAAPATELGALLQDDIDDISGVTIGAYAFSSYALAYNFPLDSILTQEGIIATPKMSNLCLIGQNEQIHTIAHPLIGNYVANSPLTVPAWAAALDKNTPGKSKLPVPLFIAQGAIDTLIKPTITQSFAAKQKSLGADVTYLSIPQTGHGMVALRAMPQMLQWLQKL